MGRTERKSNNVNLHLFHASHLRFGGAANESKAIRCLHNIGKNKEVESQGERKTQIHLVHVPLS